MKLRQSSQLVAQKIKKKKESKELVNTFKMMIQAGHIE